MHEDVEEDVGRQQQICLSLILRWIAYILDLSIQPLQNGVENVVSLDSNMPRLYEFVCNWLQSEICGEYAVKLLETLILRSMLLNC